ncbi:MAG: oligosaccharide flippase family protein, partial [Planctomycetales bacterium]|nr:oligosaccharide flippase family protein [Planctomycetales bacterium]
LKRQAALVVLGDAISFAASFVSSMLLARVIALETMGSWQQVAYLTTMWASVLEMGISTSVYRFWVRFPDAERAVFARMLIAGTATCGVVAMASLAVAAPVLSQLYGNRELLTLLLIGVAIPGVRIPLQLIRPVMICQGASLRATMVETVLSVATTLALVVPCMMGRSLAYALVMRVLITLPFLVLIPLVFAGVLQRAGRWWSRAIFAEVWGYLWPIQIARISGHLVNYLDKVVMSVVAGPGPFAIYSLGAREIPFIGQIGSSISSVLIPRLISDIDEQNWGEVKRRWAAACTSTAMLTYPIATFCMVQAVPIMRLLFSDVYRESAIPFRIFAATTILRVVEYASLAKAMGRTDLIMRSSFISGGALLLLAPLLGWWWGPMGMAMAVLLAQVSNAGYLLTSYWRQIPGSLHTFYPWPRLLTILGLAMSVHIASGYLMGGRLQIDEEGRFILLAAKLAILFVPGAAVYLIGLHLLGYLQWGHRWWSKARWRLS